MYFTYEAARYKQLPPQLPAVEVDGCVNIPIIGHSLTVSPLTVNPAQFDTVIIRKILANKNVFVATIIM